MAIFREVFRQFQTVEYKCVCKWKDCHNTGNVALCLASFKTAADSQYGCLRIRRMLLIPLTKLTQVSSEIGRPVSTSGVGRPEGLTQWPEGSMPR